MSEAERVPIRAPKTGHGGRRKRDPPETTVERPAKAGPPLGVKSRIRAEMVRCCRKGCKSCPHGPYLYEYWTENRRLRKRYLGKEGSPAHVGGNHSEVEDAVPPTLYAYDVLGVRSDASFSAIRRTYRDLVRSFCPHSGTHDPERYAEIRSAWDTIRGERR